MNESMTLEKILKNKSALEEINRYKWLQSELCGHDIGFETAASEWYHKYAADWAMKQAPKAVKPAIKKKK